MNMNMNVTHRTLVTAMLASVLICGCVGQGTSDARVDEAAISAAEIDLPPLFEAWLHTYEVEDAAGFAALYTPDGVYEDVPSGGPAQGRDEIEADAVSYFEYQDDY